VRFEKALLRQVRTAGAGEIRDRILRRFRVGKDVGLVRPLVHRRAAEFGEPDRLPLRLPHGRISRFHSADAMMVRVRPPAGEVLVAIDPMLAVSAVADRRALPCPPRFRRGIVPVETFAACDRRREPVRVIGTCKTIRIGARIIGIAPVRQRHVIVDAHSVDRRVRPQRVEMKPYVAAAVRRLE
jgi:hypothetical protein